MSSIKMLSDEIRWNYLSVGATAAGDVHIPVGTVGNGSPVCTIVAGIHGDENPWGFWAIQEMLKNVSVSELKGTLRIVSMANPIATVANARCAPLDHLDLNRCFPGNPEGSYTEMLAYELSQFAVEGADYVIDLHGGGSWCLNAFTFYFGETNRALSEAFGAPFIVNGENRKIGPVSLTAYAKSKGLGVVAVEMGGHWTHERKWANRIAIGLQRALNLMEVIDKPHLDDPEISREVGPTEVLRPKKAGIFEPHINPDLIGKVVPKGTVLGYVRDSGTWEIHTTFEAPYEETALLLLRPGLVPLEAGAMTFVIAKPIEK